jgi:hypothetical protein
MAQLDGEARAARERAVALVGARGGRGSGSGTGGSLLRLCEARCRQSWPASCPGGATLVRPRWLEEDDTVELGMEERWRAHWQRLRRNGDTRPTVAERWQGTAWSRAWGWKRRQLGREPRSSVEKGTALGTDGVDGRWEVADTEGHRGEHSDGGGTRGFRHMVQRLGT